jgi:hypothetical protein
VGGAGGGSSSYVDPSMLGNHKPTVNDFGDTLASLMSEEPSGPPLDPFGFHRADEFHARLYGDGIPNTNDPSSADVYSPGSAPPDLFDGDFSSLQQHQHAADDRRQSQSPGAVRRHNSMTAKANVARQSRLMRRSSPSPYASTSQPPQAIVIPSTASDHHRIGHDNQAYPLSVPTYINTDQGTVGSPSWLGEPLSASQGSYDSPMPRGFELAEEARKQRGNFVPNSAPAGSAFSSSSRKPGDVAEAPTSQ